MRERFQHRPLENERAEPLSVIRVVELEAWQLVRSMAELAVITRVNPRKQALPLDESV